MKKKFTLISLLVLSLFQAKSQTVLWGGPTDPNSSFSGGLNDWTTVGLSSVVPDSAKNAVWTWTATGDPKKGAFSSNLRAINSPTGSTGAAIFNSDFLDCAGDENKLGSGSAPSAHAGALISPVINCSTFTTVAFSFYQFYRNYDSRCFVEISTDGGANWKSRTEINSDVITEGISPRDSRKVIDFSADAKGQATVQFRFVFEGDYYFWIVDDVSLVTLPDNDLSLINVQYPASSYKIPETQICDEVFNFRSIIANNGGMDQVNVNLKTEILNSDKSITYFTDNTGLGNLAITDDKHLLASTTTFSPKSLLSGKYYIKTTLSSSAGADFNPRDNVKTDSFEVTSVEFAKEPRPVYGIRANGGTAYAVGALYQASTCWGPFDKFKVKSIDFALSSNTAGGLNGYKANVYLAKVNNDVDATLSNFSKIGGIENNTSMSVLAKESFVGSNQNNFDIIHQGLNNNSGIAMEVGSRYFAFVEHPEEADVNNPDTWKFQGASNEKNYQHRPFNTVAIDNQGTWFENGWPDGEAPVVRLELVISTKVDEKSLADDAIKMIPNLIVNGEANIVLHFDKATDSNLTLFDINGKVLDFQTHTAVSEKIISINTVSYASGQYYARVSTQNGTKTIKFVVAK